MIDPGISDNYNWLFKEGKMGSKIVPNLLVANPVERNSGTPEGKPTDSSYERYCSLARGKWGVVFVECTTVSDKPSERGHYPDGFLLNDNTVDDFASLVREMRAINPETIIMIQICTGSLGGSDETFLNLSADDIKRAQDRMVKGKQTLL